MKNKTAKTKIIILSIIAILVILLVGFLVYRNKNKEEGSNLFSDIFSILPSSRDATEVEAIAGVTIQKNEPVSRAHFLVKKVMINLLNLHRLQLYFVF